MRTAKNAIAVAVTLATAAVSAAPALVPAPRHMKAGDGVYDVKASNINDVVVHASHDKSLPPEGYRLVVTTGGVFVASADAAGAFYAHQTLGSWLDAARTRSALPFRRPFPALRL